MDTNSSLKEQVKMLEQCKIQYDNWEAGLKKAGKFVLDKSAKKSLDEAVLNGFVTPSGIGELKPTALSASFVMDCISDDKKELLENFYQTMYENTVNNSPEIQELLLKKESYYYIKALYEYDILLTPDQKQQLIQIFKENMNSNVQKKAENPSEKVNFSRMVFDKSKWLRKMGYVEAFGHLFDRYYYLTAKGYCCALDLISIEEGKQPSYMISRIKNNLSRYGAEEVYDYIHRLYCRKHSYSKYHAHYYDVDNVWNEYMQGNLYLSDEQKIYNML